MAGHPRIVYLTGPTACGKSAVGMRLAELLQAEIVSADSRQMYREMSIGTDKPSESDLSRIPHHLVDCRSIRDPMSAGAFAREASDVLESILARGATPIVVGGSTLYLQALVFGLADIPSAAPSIRSGLLARLETEGAAALFDELRRIDPSFAATLDVTKTQRIVRGLEVFNATGQPLSDFFSTATPPAFDFRVFVLHRNRTELYERIDRRVGEMMAAGLIDEARTLAGSGFDLEANPLRTIGYHECSGYLRGEYDRDELMRRIRVNSRRYAKRQLTWLRRYPTFEWIDLSGQATEDVARSLADLVARAPGVAGAAPLA